LARVQDEVRETDGGKEKRIWPYHSAVRFHGLQNPSVLTPAPTYRGWATIIRPLGGLINLLVWAKFAIRDLGFA